MRRHVPPAPSTRLRAAGLVLIGSLLLALGGAAPAFAGAWWRVSSRVAPTFLTPGGKAVIIVSATNVGDAGGELREQAGDDRRHTARGP